MGTLSNTNVPSARPISRKGSIGTNSTFHTSLRNLRPMPMALMQSSNTTMGIANFSGIRCASSGTAISVEPNPDMPKIR